MIDWQKMGSPEGQELAVIFVIVLLIQILFLPCLCDMGSAKLTFGLIIDLLVILRLIVARFRKEKGKVWLFYILLLFLSPLWIEFLVLLIGLH